MRRVEQIPATVEPRPNRHQPYGKRETDTDTFHSSFSTSYRPSDTFTRTQRPSCLYHRSHQPVRPPNPAPPLSVPLLTRDHSTADGNEVFFKIKRTTKLNKLKNAYADRVGKQMTSIRCVRVRESTLQSPLADCIAG